jgi:hypothetical protein
MNGKLKLKLEDGRVLAVSGDSVSSMCKFIKYGDTGTLYNDERQRTKFKIDAEDMLPPEKICDIMIPQLDKDDNAPLSLN